MMGLAFENPISWCVGRGIGSFIHVKSGDGVAGKDDGRKDGICIRDLRMVIGGMHRGVCVTGKQRKTSMRLTGDGEDNSSS